MGASSRVHRDDMFEADREGMSTSTIDPQFYISKINALVTDDREELIPSVIDEYDGSTAPAAACATATWSPRLRARRRPSKRKA
jgi:hypothetical protein